MADLGRKLLAGVFAFGTLFNVNGDEEEEFRPPKLDPKTLTNIIFGMYNDQFQIPVVELFYDTDTTDEDRTPNVVMLYTLDIQSQTESFTTLVSYAIDYDGDGFEDHEQVIDPKFMRRLKEWEARMEEGE
jgi:hypothetical protein